MSTAPILLAYDGSPEAELALDWAAEEARETRTPLVTMMVDDLPSVPPVVAPRHGSAPVLVSDAPGVLDRARAALERAHVRDVTFEHRGGRVVGEILDAAGTASLVVLGSRGHGPVGELFLGSVSQLVARHAPCPVVVVRRPHTPGAHRIVVGVDGSPGSRAAIEHACRRADRTGEPVVALHGWRVHTPSTDVWSARPRTLEGEDERRRQLAEITAGIAQEHPDVQLEVEAVPVDAAQCLVDASANASLLVVGARGHSFVGGLLLGSVSQAVLRRADCPVAVVR